jgi:hypothetical protein
MYDIVMRDDLHRTVGLNQRWRRVIRNAKAKADRIERLPASVVDAVRLSLNDGIRKSWLTDLRTAVREASSDLFGPDQMHAALRQFATNAASTVEREVVDCVRARAAFESNGQLVTGAVVEVGARLRDRQFELLVAQVRAKYPRDAAELRGVLSAAKEKCDMAKVVDGFGNIASRSVKKLGIDLNELVE